MYEIDFCNKNFEISINISYEEKELFFDYVNFLKSLYLKYDSQSKNWICPYSRIDELIMWFKKRENEYVITERAEIEYQNFLKSFTQETEFFRGRKFDSSILNKDVSLFEYQKIGVDWLLKRSRAYLADDAGLGKTLQIICTISQLYKDNEIDSVFLVVRNGLAYNWKREFLNFASIFKEEDFVLISNESKIKPFEKNKGKKIFIISNHLLADMFASYRKDYKRGMKLSKFRWNKPFVDVCVEWNKKSIALVIDESHELKSTRALRTKAIFAHKQFFKYRYLCSATPSINFFESWWAGMNLLDSSIIPFSENAFKIYIAKDIGNKWSMYNINSYNEKRINEVRNKFSNNVLKRLKKDLPEVKTKQTIKPIYLQMTVKQQLLYNSFIRNEVLRLKEEFDKVTLKLIMQKFPYFQQIIDNAELLQGKVSNPEVNKLLEKWKFIDDPRYEYTKYALDEYVGNLNEKVIIFDTHPKTLNSLAILFKKYNPLVIHGQLDDDAESRQKKQDLFNDKNSDNKLFLLSTQIGGVGANLHYACRRIIFYTLPYDATLFRQAQDRVWRISSEFDSIVEMLILDHSIDNIRHRRNISRTILNDEILNRNLSESDIKNLFLGIFFTNN